MRLSIRLAMTTRSLTLAIYAGFLASFFAVRAEGAIMGCAAAVIASEATDQVPSPTERQNKSDASELFADQCALPSGSSSGATAPSGGSTSPILAATLASELDLVVAPQLATGLTTEMALFVPDPPTSGLLRPPRDLPY